jgi:hypothetical protein
LALCGVGVGIWLWTDLPWVGLCASVAADMIAMLPALRKTVRLPHTELFLFYALDTVAGLLVVAAGPFTVRAIIFPLYIALINAAFAAAIRWPRKQSDVL